MITVFWQLISCRSSTKTEILGDHAAARAPKARPSPRTALTGHYRTKDKLEVDAV
jgi:hypothetical protein